MFFNVYQTPVLDSVKSRVELSTVIIKRTLLKAISDDFIFTLLPIAIILIIRVAMDDLKTNVWLLPDWSFASIVLLGASISRFIEAKSNYEDDRTYRMFLGVRLLTFFLILGVITLALSVVNNITSFGNDIFIIFSQIIVFVIATCSVFYTHYIIRRHIENGWFTQVRTNSAYYFHANKNAITVKNRLRYLNKITLNYGYFSENEDKPFVQNIDDNFQLDDFKNEIKAIEKELDYLKKEVERRSKT